MFRGYNLSKVYCLFHLRYCIQSNADGPLVGSTVRSFVEQLGARTSAPGGGSASACIASMVHDMLYNYSISNV